MLDGDRLHPLFVKYVQMRQADRSRDAAWRTIETAVLFLPPQDRELLLDSLHYWETTEGQSLIPASDPDATLMKSPLQRAQKRNVIRRIEPEPAAPFSPAAISQPDQRECPACHKPNMPDAVHCYSCGAILRGVAPVANGTRPLAPDSVDNAFFDENWVLYLKLQSASETLRIYPRLTEVILGRKSPESVMIPDVDLSPYGASEKGVSRLHASLRRHEKTLVLSDLGSVNHTFINGQRVHPHEVRALHDGDEIRLGSLLMYAYFRDA